MSGRLALASSMGRGMKTDLPFTSIHRHGFVRVGAAKPSVRLGDPAANVDNMVELARRAAGEGADLVVYPELCISGYSIEDLHLQHALQDACETQLVRFAEAAADLGCLLIAGLPLRKDGRLFNCAAV